MARGGANDTHETSTAINRGQATLQRLIVITESASDQDQNDIMISNPILPRIQNNKPIRTQRTGSGISCEHGAQ